MLTAAFSPRRFVRALAELGGLLRRHRNLVVEMARREAYDRYLGQVFGTLWVLAHPLILIATYIFVFAFVFKVRIGTRPGIPADYTTYLLSGLIPWLAFQEVLAKSATAIVANANLVKQVIFPVEVIPVKSVLSSLVTMCVLLSGLTAYLLVAHGALPWTYLLVPLLVVVQALAMTGVAFSLAAVGVYFRDLKDFVQVFNVVGVYLIPAFYLPEFVPQLLRPLLYLNPFSYLIWCYQDALFFGRLEHWWAWLVTAALALVAFVWGYRLFRTLKVMFGNVL
jgi:lipopolysaccharide transport system permease protein